MTTSQPPHGQEPISAPSAVIVTPSRWQTRHILRQLWDTTGMLLVFLLLLGYFALFVPRFFSTQNMTGLAQAVTTVGIVACTMLFCLAAGDFDLSVGSTVALGGMIAAVVMNKTGSVTLGACAALLAGGLVGLFNGLIIAGIGINALITTLATMQIVRGLSYKVSDGKTVGIGNSDFLLLGTTRFGGIPIPVLIMIACFVLFGILLKRTTFGRNTLAVGGNPEAGRLAGISVLRTKVVIFTLQGMISALTGLILASVFNVGQPSAGLGLELQVISACVLGGVSLTGGVGTMFGVVIGVLMMGAVNNAMNLKGLDTFYQYIVSGSILLAAVLIDRLKQGRSAD